MNVTPEESEEAEPSEHPLYARAILKHYVSLPRSVVIGLLVSGNLSFGFGELDILQRNTEVSDLHCRTL